MPHKHTRRSTNDLSSKDLPPTSIARPLPVTKRDGSDGPNNKKRKAKPVKKDDDTPWAFQRVMAMQNGVKRSRDLDEGIPASARKKRKENKAGTSDSTTTQAESVKSPNVMKIMPGERMSDFSARVNQALPISGLSRKIKHIEGVKERQTRLEKKIKGKITRWKAEEAKRKEAEEEQADIAEQEDAEQYTREGEQVLGGIGKRKKATAGGTKAHDDDPWAALRKVRDKPKGLFDVAQAPPNFTRIPTEKFKIKNGARVDTMDVPRAAGSLRQREELGNSRKSIIETYRKLMESKRNAE